MLDRLLCAHREEVWQTRDRRRWFRGPVFETGYWCPECYHYRRAAYRLPLRRTGRAVLSPEILIQGAVLAVAGWLLWTLS